MDLDLSLKLMQREVLERMDFVHTKTLGTTLKAIAKDGFVASCRRFPEKLSGTLKMALSRLQGTVHDVPKFSAVAPDAFAEDAENDLSGELTLSLEGLSDGRFTSVEYQHDEPSSLLDTSPMELDPILMLLVHMSSLPHQHVFPAQYLETVGFPRLLNRLIRRSFSTIDFLLTKPKRRLGGGEGEIEADELLLAEWRRLAMLFRLLANFASWLPRSEESSVLEKSCLRPALWMNESMHLSLCCQYLIASILVERGMIPCVRGTLSSSMPTRSKPSRFLDSVVPPSSVYYGAQRYGSDTTNTMLRASWSTTISHTPLPLRPSFDKNGLIRRSCSDLDIIYHV